MQAQGNPSENGVRRAWGVSPADIAAATAVVRQFEAQKTSRGAEGTQFKDSDLTTAHEKLDKLKERLAPYERELQTRASPSA